MSLYDKYVLPKFLNCACGSKPVEYQRKKVVPNAEGIVFDRASGESISDSYKNYLNTVFSNTARQKNETEMEIAISLTHEKKKIKIIRKWWFDDTFDEVLEIYTEGDGVVQPLEIPEEEIDLSEYYEAFIQTIIPRALVHLQ